MCLQTILLIVLIIMVVIGLISAVSTDTKTRQKIEEMKDDIKSTRNNLDDALRKDNAAAMELRKLFDRFDAIEAKMRRYDRRLEILNDRIDDKQEAVIVEKPGNIIVTQLPEQSNNKKKNKKNKNK